MPDNKDNNNGLGLTGLFNSLYGQIKSGFDSSNDFLTNFGKNTTVGKDLYNAYKEHDLGFSKLSDEELNNVTAEDVMTNAALKPNPWKTGEYNDAGFSLEGALNATGITYDRLKSRILNLYTINKNRVTNPIDATAFGRTYVFFTKPDLHLFMNDGVTINPSIEANCKDLYTKIRKNPSVAKLLQTSYSTEGVMGSGGDFIHLLGSMCTDFGVPEMSLSTREVTKNIKGYGIKYGGDFLEALKETSISISFIDNRYKDVSTLIEIWTEYIEGVAQGKIYPKKKYRDCNILDYAISIFVFVVDETNNIVAHSGLVGCYPKSLNVELLRHKRSTLTVEDFMGPFAYEWQVSHAMRPNAQSTIEMFNFASGFSKLREVSSMTRAFGVTYNYDFMAKLGEVGKNTESSTEYIMHQSIEPWGSDIIRYGENNDDEDKDKSWYHHQLTISEYWPEHAGVIMTPTSAMTMQYTLIFYSTKNYLNMYDKTQAKVVDYGDIIDYSKFDTELENAYGNRKTVNAIDLGMYYWKRKLTMKVNAALGYIDLTKALGERVDPLPNDKLKTGTMFKKPKDDGTGKLLYTHAAPSATDNKTLSSNDVSTDSRYRDV